MLNEAGQVVRVVAPAKTDTELEREAAQARVRDAEAAAEAAQLGRGMFLLRRYSKVADIQAARDRSLLELDIRISILNSQWATSADQLARHEANLAFSTATDESASQCEQETVDALQAEIASLDEAMAGRKQKSAALADAHASDMAHFAELEDILALRRQLTSPDTQQQD